jgi:antitoxin MazE
VRVVLKVHKKGIIVLPKKLREALEVDEGDEVVAELVGDKLVIRALKPKIVDVDPEIVERLLGEEFSLEKSRYARMVSGEEAGS